MIGRIRSSSSFEDITSRKRADISRLLDPTYNKEQRHTTYGAYVDSHGEFHDPDYRQFPLIQPYNAHTNKNTISYRNYSNNLNAYYNNAQRRRYWERTDDDSALLMEDEEEYYSMDDSWKRNSYGSSSRSSNATKRRSPPHHYYSSKGLYNNYTSSGAILSPCSAHQHEVTLPYFSPSSSSTDSSYSTQGSSVLCGAQFDGEKEKEKSRCRLGASLKRRRRRSSGSTAEKEKKKSRCEDAEERYDEDDAYPSRLGLVENVEEEEREREVDEEDEDKHDRVPTCTESLKRQWQAMSFRIRFGMFRAERRIKQRVQSLI